MLNCYCFYNVAYFLTESKRNKHNMLTKKIKIGVDKPQKICYNKVRSRWAKAQVLCYNITQFKKNQKKFTLGVDFW